MQQHNTGPKEVKKQRKVSEIDLVNNYLRNHIATATQVAKALNIYRPNVCRHKRELEKEGVLIEVGKAPCPITHFIAAFLTTDPEFIKRRKK